MKQLIVISSYPPFGSTHHHQVVGVATYTKNTLKALSQSYSPEERPKITVLAEVLSESESQYEEDGITVKRVWRRKSLTSFWQLFKAIRKTKTKDVVFELELAMFGGIIHLLPLPLFLLYLKFTGRKTTIVAHQIITSVADVHGQLNLPEKGFKPTLLTFLLRLFYRIILLFSSQVIVFDEYLKGQLGKFGSPEKIVVIPHGIETFTDLPTQKEAKTKLNLPQDRPILLYFGFLAWYKGTDILLDAYAKLPEKNRPVLVIAGGPNPNHTDKKFYQDYIESLTKKAESEGAIITGFVPEELIPYYFAASDVCILPYRTFMSSSGPLSFVFAAHKPFLLSHRLKPVFATEDIAAIIRELGISEDELTFTTQTDLEEKITELLSNTSLQKNVSELDLRLVNSRKWSEIGKRYRDAL